MVDTLSVIVKHSPNFLVFPYYTGGAMPVNPFSGGARGAFASPLKPLDGQIPARSAWPRFFHYYITNIKLLGNSYCDEIPMISAWRRPRPPRANSKKASPVLQWEKPLVLIHLLGWIYPWAARSSRASA
ncbi:hypothetical protein FD37_GL001867 [Levilactobacillus spicheri DSM 15429]|uniref:Uncharacterized protein n=1 Tax=Levilactobacillus spicheri DSM 15429 TaxID=1423805 RepID=A0A0R1R328_9LACO|nr:hypothetical protein FD37_GL001867 [Levilactobacillus spicheri DSM 15429]